jgi:hypothetical protein
MVLTIERSASDEERTARPYDSHAELAADMCP